MSADLEGNPTRFWTNGHDAWMGMGTLNCPRKGSLAIEVSYFGLEPGYGANQNSKIHFDLTGLDASDVHLIENPILSEGGDYHSYSDEISFRLSSVILAMGWQIATQVKLPNQRDYYSLLNKGIFRLHLLNTLESKK